MSKLINHVYNDTLTHFRKTRPERTNDIGMYNRNVMQDRIDVLERQYNNTEDEDTKAWIRTTINSMESTIKKMDAYSKLRREGIKPKIELVEADENISNINFMISENVDYSWYCGDITEIERNEKITKLNKGDD